ncbi:hypothetical protein D3C86_1700930 [compost metagenome]
MVFFTISNGSVLRVYGAADTPVALMLMKGWPDTGSLPLSASIGLCDGTSQTGLPSEVDCGVKYQMALTLAVSAPSKLSSNST